MSKPVTPHYLANIIASSSVMPQQVVIPAPSSSRYSSKIVTKPSVKAHKDYYLEKDRKRALLQKDGILGSQPGRMPPSVLRNNAYVQPEKSRMCYKSPTMHVKQNKPKVTPRWIPTAISLDSRNIDEPLTMHKKLSNPRTCKKWVPTGRKFMKSGLMSTSSGRISTNDESMNDLNSIKGLGADYTNSLLCKQVCYVSAGCPCVTAGDLDRQG